MFFSGNTLRSRWRGMRQAPANGCENRFYRFYRFFRFCRFYGSEPNKPNKPNKPNEPNEPLLAVPGDRQLGTVSLPIAVFRVALQNIFSYTRELFPESAFIHECLHGFVLQTAYQKITLVDQTDHDICAGPIRTGLHIIMENIR